MATEAVPQTVHVAPRITKTPGVCGSRAVIENTRIAVWLLVGLRDSGRSDGELLDDYPHLTSMDLAAAWDYAASHQEEIGLDLEDQGPD